MLRVWFGGQSRIAAVLSLCCTLRPLRRGAGQEDSVQKLMERGALDEAVQRAERDRGNPESTYLAAQALIKMNNDGGAGEQYSQLREMGDADWKAIGDSGAALLERRRGRSVRLPRPARSPPTATTRTRTIRPASSPAARTTSSARPPSSAGASSSSRTSPTATTTPAWRTRSCGRRRRCRSTWKRSSASRRTRRSAAPSTRSCARCDRGANDRTKNERRRTKTERNSERERS